MNEREGKRVITTSVRRKRKGSTIPWESKGVKKSKLKKREFVLDHRFFLVETDGWRSEVGRLRKGERKEVVKEKELMYSPKEKGERNKRSAALNGREKEKEYCLKRVSGRWTY